MATPLQFAILLLKMEEDPTGPVNQENMSGRRIDYSLAPPTEPAVQISRNGLFRMCVLFQHN